MQAKWMEWGFVVSTMLIAAGWLLMHPIVAMAEPVAKMANVNEGHFYLTFEPCPAKFNLPITDTLYRAYAVDFEGTDHERVVEACWVSPEIDWSQIPEEDRPHVVRAITILAPEGHETYLWSDFEPVNPPEPQMRGEF